MMDGIRYSVTIHPGYVSIPERNAFFFKLDGKDVMVGIDHHIDSVHITDLHNSLKITDAGTASLEKPTIDLTGHHYAAKYIIADGEIDRIFVYDYEIGREKFLSSRFYTLLIIAYEVNPDNLTDEDYAFGRRVLTEFLTAYKFISGDARVRLPDDILHDHFVEKEDVIRYSDSDRKLSVIERLGLQRAINLRIKTLKAIESRESVPQSEIKMEKIRVLMTDYLSIGKPLSDEIRLLLKANEEIDLHRNYKYGLLECFIVAESLISKVLRSIKLNRGVSKNKLDEYETEVSISYQINVELPAFLESISSSERRVLGQIDRIRRLRNDVVHKGKTIGREDALSAMEAVSELLLLFQERALI